MLLTLPLTKATEEIIRPLTGSELSAIQKTLGYDSLSLLRRMSISELMGRFSLSQKEAYRICILLDREVMLMHLLEECSGRGIDVVTPYDAGYPSRLRMRCGGLSAPPVFFFGDLNMLEKPCAGITGATGIKTPDMFKDNLKTLIPWLARSGISLVTSGDPGACYHARAAADAHDLPLVTVTNGAMGELSGEEVHMANAIRGREILVSTLNPFSAFTPEEQPAVNRLIYSLSLAAFAATVPVRNSEHEAVKKHWCPFLYAFDTPGNAQLISRGFSPVSTLTDEWLDSVSRFWLNSEHEQLSFL